jgi:hypothetical protein
MPRTGGELFIHAKASRRDVLYSLVTTFVDYLGDSVLPRFSPSLHWVCVAWTHAIVSTCVRVRRSWTTST